MGQPQGSDIQRPRMGRVEFRYLKPSVENGPTLTCTGAICTHNAEVVPLPPCAPTQAIPAAPRAGPAQRGAARTAPPAGKASPEEAFPRCTDHARVPPNAAKLGALAQHTVGQMLTPS